MQGSNIALPQWLGEEWSQPGETHALCISGWSTRDLLGRSYRRRPGALLTAVLPLDESLPLSEPVHADAVDDCGRLLSLERLIQLWGKADRGSQS